MTDYLLGSLLWSAVGLLGGVAVTETAWYVRWRLSRERRKGDHT